MNKKEKFITKAKLIHGDKYDYSKVEYVNSNTKVSIICPTHNVFLITPEHHIQKQGCKKCGLISRINKRKKQLSDFIFQANNVHFSKYDYSKVEYVNNRKEVSIICPIHGEFKQIPRIHLSGHGCKKCSGKIKSVKQLCNTETFIKKSKLIHGDKYDYSKVEYIGSQKYVKIICSLHGEFKQFPNSHLKGRGCPTCGSEIKGGWTSTKWLEKSTKSKMFDSFKVYVIECYNDNERFIKIGRTFKTLFNRFEFKHSLPYQYNILKIIENDNHKEVFNLETKIKKSFKEHSYKPLLTFAGRNECFNIDQKNNILLYILSDIQTKR